jgi:hypothetical protein
VFGGRGVEHGAARELSGQGGRVAYRPRGVFTRCGVTTLQAVSRLRAARGRVPRVSSTGHGGQGSLGWGAGGCRGRGQFGVSRDTAHRAR